jgi:hypothetical protein
LSVYDLDRTVSGVVLLGALFGLGVFLLAALRPRSRTRLRLAAAVLFGTFAYGWNASILIVGGPMLRVLAGVGFATAVAAAVVVARAWAPGVQRDRSLFDHAGFRFAAIVLFWTALLVVVWRLIGFPPPEETRPEAVPDSYSDGS